MEISQTIKRRDWGDANLTRKCVTTLQILGLYEAIKF